MDTIIDNRTPEQIALYDATEALIASDLETWRLARLALTQYDRATLTRPMWREISTTSEDAADYYASLDEDVRRSEAALVLAANGWTRSDCWRVFA